MKVRKIYQFLLALIFFFIYGKVKRIISIKNTKDSNYKKVVLNKKIYKIYEINKCRLYSDRIHNIAIIKNNNLVKEPSFQTKYYNKTSAKNNSVLRYGTPRKLKRFKGACLSLLTGGGGNANYFHWMFDVLPRLKLANDTFGLKNINYFLLPSIKNIFQIQTLDYLGIFKNKIITNDNYKHLYFDKLVITDHPYVFSNNSRLDVQKIPNWIINWLKSKFYKIGNTKNSFKKIYIQRNKNKILDANQLSRNIFNEDELIFFLKKKGFKIINLEGLNLNRQASIFRNAKVIIGLHGAAFTNLIFCRSNTKIIELKNTYTKDMYLNIAKKNNLKYYGVICKTVGKSINQQGVIKVDINKIKNLIENL